MKMDVLIVQSMMVLAVAKFVLKAATAILNGMNKIVRKKERKSTENGRFVECKNRLFKISNTHRMTSTHQYPANQYAICRWLNITLLESFDDYVRFHLRTL